jgi:hypothetical protein
MCTLVAIIGFVILTGLALWLSRKFPFESIWHYHESGCRGTFRLAQKIKGGAKCPACLWGYFGETITKVYCEVCKQTYYTDVQHKIGDKLVCPLHHGPVVMTDKSSIGPNAPDPPPDKKVLRGRKVLPKVVVAITVPALALYIGLNFLSSFISMLAAAGSTSALTLSTLLASVIGFLDVVLPAVGWGLVGVILAAGLYSLLHALSAMISNDFNQIHQSAQAEDPFEELRRQYQRRPKTPPETILRDTVDKSRYTILRQQLVIGILIIGMSVGALTCYLSVKTFEAARRVLQQAVLLGSTNIILFCIVFYSGKIFFKIDKKLISKGRFAWKLFLAGAFGTASVSTLILLPPLLGESVLAGSTVAIQLVINIIVDVVINTYDAIVTVVWKGFRQAVQDLTASFWEWLSYQKS